MTVMTRKDSQWDPVRRRILAEGVSAPQSLQVDMNLTCNGINYILRVQPDKGRKIVALQATQAVISPETGRREFRLIENKAILVALLHVMVYPIAQKIAQETEQDVPQDLVELVATEIA